MGAPPADRPDVGKDSTDTQSLKEAKVADGELEGMLDRKHAWVSPTKKAANRSWDRVFTVLKGDKIHFYKDQKAYRTTPDVTFRGESPIEIVGSEAEVAEDYTKKKHVFRLRLSNGGDYLFHCIDDEEMGMWISNINNKASGESGPGKSQTLPASASKDEPKRRSFFTHHPAKIIIIILTLKEELATRPLVGTCLN